jgi:F-box interacting protein
MKWFSLLSYANQKHRQKVLNGMTFFFHYFTLNHLSRKLSKRRRRRRRRSMRPFSQTTKKPSSAAAAACTTIMDLPGPILIDILSRLPFKSISDSRCVCTTWRSLVSDPLFASMHFARAQTLEVLLHPKSVGCASTTLHWVDLDCIFKTAPPVDRNERRETKLNTKFYLPLPGCNIERKCLKENTNSRRSSLMDQYGIVNSCNGLLCLSKPIYNNPRIICNPLTGEYVRIPKSQGDDMFLGPVIPGFGYSQRSNKYKVVRSVCQPENMFQTMAEVYTVGTASWRSIGCAPFDLGLALFTTYLNGVVHWVSDTASGPVVIVAFDFEEEQFSVISLPPHFGETHKERENLHNMNMGVLGGCLSVCDVTFWDHFDIWVMKEYGDPTSWTKEHVICAHSGCLHRPIKFLENGDILMIYNKAELVAYSPVEGYFRYLKIDGILAVFEAITHVPSFVPLADAVMGDHLNVQNIKARYYKFEFFQANLNDILLLYWMVLCT